MEILSQSEIKIINNTSSLYILFCLLVTLISLVLLYDKTKKNLILSCITVIGFTVVVLLAYTESMCTSINKYDYKAEITVPEIDSSKYTVLGNTTQKIDVNIQDKLTEEEENSLKRTTNFTIIVTVYRIICLMIWLIYFTTFIENSALTISFKEDSYLSLIMGLCIFLSAIGIIIVTVVYGSHPFPI